MTLDAVSAWVAINHRTLPNPATVCYSFGFNEAIPAAAPSIHLYSNKWRRVMQLKHRIHVKQSLDAVWLPARGRGNLSPRTLAFTKPNESNEGERGLSYDCMESQVSMPSENGEGSNNSDLEADDVLSHLEDNSSIGGYLSDIGLLLDKLKSIPLHLLASEQWNASRLKSCHRNHVPSATNLIHYLAMKFFLDIDQLKQDHPCMGLFNLEAINSCILPSLTVAIQSMENDARSDNQETLQKQKSAMITIHKMKKKAISNRDLLLGSLQEDRITHIMVTVGEEAINSDTLITDLLEAGTSVIRINCAHGDSIVWNEIINRVKRSSQMLEKPCRILMDLAGPKLRTGKLKPGPSVIKISPKKNGNGNVISPAQVWLSYRGAGESPSHLSPDAVLFIDDVKFLSELEIGDTLRFCDARGKSRDLKVSRRVHFFAGTGYMTECTRTAYVSSGTELRVKRKKGKFLVGQVVDIPAKEQYIKLGVGDLLVISRDSSDEKQYDPSSTTNGTQMVTCPSGLLFNSVKPGEPIAFDDGKLWGVIKANSSSEIVVSITHASRKGTKLGSQKSINIPNSNICFEGLTSKDLMDLEFVAVHADMVGMSFVRDIDDIVVLRQELEKRKLHNLGIVIKIETRGAFENLPLMLLEAMKSPNPLGVMIARGDLAVECGWERLADIQEEILSICDAAHVPVIWATQVLESLVKSGVPTRAEITDVASGKRSSCIMLNKGEKVVEAVKFLDTIMCNSSKQKKGKISLVPSSPIFS